MYNKITDLNKNVATFSFRPEKEFEYCTLEELYKTNGKDKVYQVNALYLNDSLYGKQGLAVTNDEYVNLPSHLNDAVKQIRDNEQLVVDINNGLVGFKIYEYKNKKYNKFAYSVEWVELVKPALKEVYTDDIPF